MAVISVVPKKVLNLKQPRSAKMQEVTQMQRRSASASLSSTFVYFYWLKKFTSKISTLNHCSHVPVI